MGSLSVIKEFNFAGDLMEAVWMLVNQTAVYEAVIGSGQGHSILEWVINCFDLIGKDWRPHVDIIKGYVPEFAYLVANPATLMSLGWKLNLKMPELARMMMQV